MFRACLTRMFEKKGKMAKHVYSIIPGWPRGINKSTADWGRGSIDFENDRNMTATGEQSFRKREVIL